MIKFAEMPSEAIRCVALRWRVVVSLLCQLPAMFLRDHCETGSETGGLGTSQMQVRDAMETLSSASESVDAFEEQYIREKAVLEIGCGGYTNLVVHLKCLCARSAVATDITPRECWQIPGLFVEADIRRLDDSRDEICAKLCASLPDTIVGTSIFGVLSRENAKLWLTKCLDILAPSGAIVIDFLDYWDYSYRRGKQEGRMQHGGNMTQAEFEALLVELVREERVHWWLRGCRTVGKRYRRVGGLPSRRRRRPSVTYRIHSKPPMPAG